MRTKFTNKLKTAVFGMALLAVGTVSAQSLDPAVNTAQADAAGESIRLIDNKGTIKYMQANNGITTITSTIAGNRTTTTWQLGGTLTDDTYIDATGQIFALDGVKSVDTATESAATTIVDQSIHSATPANTGYALLVRDEATGETKKLLVSSLIEVGQAEYEAASDGDAAALSFTLPFASTFQKVMVYRNGAKLRANIDYTVTGTALALIPGATAPQDWEIYAGDIIEYHFSK